MMRLREDSVVDFLHERAPDEAHLPNSEPDGMCILSGQILIQNLERSLLRRGVPSEAFVRFTTIERLAEDLLSGDSRASSVLNHRLRARLIKKIFERATGDDTTESWACTQEELEAIQELARNLVYQERATMEEFGKEFDDYLRWTDASETHSAAWGTVDVLSDDFVSLKSRRSLDAFHGISKELQRLIDQREVTAHQSRSHLVRAARDVLTSGNRQMVGRMEWIAVAGISVFDAPTLRLLEMIASIPNSPDVHVFSNRGSFDYNSSRITSLEVESVTSDSASGHLESAASRALLESALGTEADPGETTLVSAPTKRRAIERVADDIRRLIQDGVPASDILVVAPDVARLRAQVRDVFGAAEVPIFPQTRQPYAELPAYNFLHAVVAAIDSVAEGEQDRLPRRTLLAPLRLGYCDPDGDTSRWPMADEHVGRVDEHFAAREQAMSADDDSTGPRLTIQQYRIIADVASDSTTDWAAVRGYLTALQRYAGQPPPDGQAVVSMLGSVVNAFSHRMVEENHSRAGAPGIDTAHQRLNRQHLSGGAEKLRQRLGAVGTQYDRMRELLDAPATWAEVERALSATVGSGSHGARHLDGQAVPFVDMGNSFFRSARHLFVLGMNSGEFPSTTVSSSFLPERLRQVVYERAGSGEAAHEHLDGRSVSYSRALDFYEATLGVAESGAEITLVHTYRDRDGGQIGWSPFLGRGSIVRTSNGDSPTVERLPAGDPLRLSGAQNCSSRTMEELLETRSVRECVRILIDQATAQPAGRARTLTPREVETVFEHLGDEFHTAELDGVLE